MDLALKIWVSAVVAVMTVFAVRHWLISVRRLVGVQRPYYHDLLDSDLPSVSVMIPMHNEHAVADQILTALLRSAYPMDLLEIIPIDDHSEDDTAGILQRFAAEYPQIRPLFRSSGARGKPAALNDALALAKNEIVLVFDADYKPGPDAVRALAMAFQDPEVGAVMGRVVPSNAGKTLLTRILDLERSGGYQVDQQVRYTLDLIPQFGGTTGGFRRSLALLGRVRHPCQCRRYGPHGAALPARLEGRLRQPSRVLRGSPRDLGRSVQPTTAVVARA